MSKAVNRYAKALVICLVATALISIYYYVTAFPTDGFRPPAGWAGFFFVVIVAIVWGARLSPIQMVDPKKQQLGEQSTVGTYEAPFCDGCGSPTGNAMYCPSCGTRTKTDAPILDRKKFAVEEKEDDFSNVRSDDPDIAFRDARTTLVPVTIEGTAEVPQGQLQNLKITKVMMGKKQVIGAETKAVRAKRVKQATEAPAPIDDSPIERSIYE